METRDRFKMLTETKIRSLCDNYHLASPNERKYLRQVSQWGLRHLFDGGCHEYSENNIYEKISTVEAICKNANCSFSDVIAAFIDQCVPSYIYRLSGVTSFFKDFYNSLSDVGEFVSASQIKSFARNREWEKWVSLMEKKHYDIIEYQFSMVFDMTFQES